MVVLEQMGDTAKKREKDNGLSGGSIDIVAMIDEEYFVSGSDSGAISLWTINKKKPLFTKLKAHGPGSLILINGEESVVEQEAYEFNPSDDTMCPWISSLASVRYTDMFASGSADGYIRLWKLSESKKSFSLLNCIPAAGFVNSLVFFEAPNLNYTAPQETQDSLKKSTAKRILDQSKMQKMLGSVPQELYLGVAIGQEHRMGRWWRKKQVKNQVIVCALGPMPA